jgi:serine protease Do
MFAKIIRRPLWPIAAGIVLAFAIGGAAGSTVGKHALLAMPGEIPPASTGTSTDNETKMTPTTFAPVVQKVMPSVVNIFSSRKADNPSRSFELFGNDPMLRRFFGDESGIQPLVPRQRQERSLGSGVIITSDGYIVTNHHVVDGGTDIKVSLGDKREYTARVVGSDNKTDLAVLKIDQTGLPALPLSDSSRVQIGDIVLAVGNPFGVGQSVAMGIVSATGRGGLGLEDYEDFIQTDAAINPGNSGGALVDAQGRLIGINTAIMSRSGGNQGVGFAIPANMARNVTDQIIHGGKVSRAFLGVMIQPVTPDLAKAFKLSKTEGALIADVNADSPAERAGLKAGDVVTKLDDRTVADSRALQLMIGEKAPGTSARLTVVRDGVEKQYTVKLGEQSGDGSASTHSGSEASSSSPLNGVSLEPITPEFARQFGISRNAKGVAVRRVNPDSAAAQAGLEAGDVILEVNRQPVETVEQVHRSIKESTTNTALLLVSHDGRTRYIVISSK